MNLTNISSDSRIQLMPVLPNKRPIHKNWESNKTEYDFTNASGVGLVCGSISGNVEVIDLDLKYDLTGTLFRDYKKAINDLDPSLLKLMVVQKTQNNGYHFIYRCSTIEGNKKLAQRATTDEEKDRTYRSAFDSELQRLTKETKLTQEEISREAALFASKQRDNDKVRVLLETRGEKGYVAVYPTPGYEFIYGDLSKINEITERQREILFDVAYSFNEYYKEQKKHKDLPRKSTKGLTPSEDYDERGDVVGLLCEHGWTEVGKRGSKVLLRRPGDTKAASSGNYDYDLKRFSVFSTSTEFEPQSPYKPYAVFAILECGGDFSQVTKKLADLGYGDSLEKIKENKIEVPSIINLSDDDMSFLATPDDFDSYLDQWRKGTFPMGLSTGLPLLDKHFRFKEDNLVIINGIDNVGKSTTIWYMAMLASVLHGWRWLIFSSENKVGSIVRKLIEFYWDKSISKQTDQEFKVARSFVIDHFDIIKTKESLYNYKDILNITKKALSKKKYKGLMVDPYNSLKIDIPSKSKQSTYEYHYEAASEIKNFATFNNIAVYLNCHVGTTGARNVDSNGYTKAPQKQDTEGGVMFANKADEFITIHRLSQHETDFMFTEIHVRKIKEVETGGRQTPSNHPVYLKAHFGITGFSCMSEKNHDISGDNAIKIWRDKTNIGNQADIFNTPAPAISFYEVDRDTEESPF